MGMNPKVHVYYNNQEILLKCMVFMVDKIRPLLNGNFSRP